MVIIRAGNLKDLKELLANSDHRDEPAADVVLDQCIKKSEYLWVGKWDNEIICAWGLIPPTILSEQAHLWMLNATNIKEHKFIVVRHSQIFMEKMLEKYPKIVGYCKAGQKHSVKWLKWLGAEFMEPHGDMLPFVIRKK